MAAFLSFTSTIHDPEARLIHLIDEVGDQLAELFHSSYVAYTPKTHDDIVEGLRGKGFEVINAGDTIVSTYQAALKQPLNKHNDRMLYCDLDRALHWIKAYPTELQTVASTNPAYDFALFGRTSRAFMTHPETQTMTEGIANTVASRELGLKETRDILGTTWILAPELAERVINRQNKNTFGFYTEWPMTLWKYATNPLYIECEGLEWETPDRYREEIQALGYAKWKITFQTPQEWRRRTEMLRDFIESSYASANEGGY